MKQGSANGDTAFMKGTKAGISTVVQEVIYMGVDVNAKNNDNNALWFACFGNHYNLINLSLAAHIDINEQTETYSPIRE